MNNCGGYILFHGGGGGRSFIVASYKDLGANLDVSLPLLLTSNRRSFWLPSWVVWVGELRLISDNLKEKWELWSNIFNKNNEKGKIKIAISNLKLKEFSTNNPCISFFLFLLFFQTRKKQGQDGQQRRSYINYLHRCTDRWVPLQDWLRVASHRGIRGMFDYITQSGVVYR